MSLWVRCTDRLQPRPITHFHTRDRGCANLEMWLRLWKEWVFDPNCLNWFLKSLSVYVKYHLDFPATSISGVELVHCPRNHRCPLGKICQEWLREREGRYMSHISFLSDSSWRERCPFSSALAKERIQAVWFVRGTKKMCLTDMRTNGYITMSPFRCK